MPKKKKDNKHPTLKAQLTVGQRAADKLTAFAGSWYFIIGLLVFIAIWMFVNAMAMIYRWDPYPFILLNFVLSCLAALQAPVILMSQNRQAERDRATAKYDYQIDRKAEREIQNIQMGLDEIKAMLKKVRKS